MFANDFDALIRITREIDILGRRRYGKKPEVPYNALKGLVRTLRALSYEAPKGLIGPLSAL